MMLMLMMPTTVTMLKGVTVLMVVPEVEDFVQITPENTLNLVTLFTYALAGSEGETPSFFHTYTEARAGVGCSPLD